MCRLFLFVFKVIGGFRAQGRTAWRARELLDDALRLQDAGVFAIVLECMPANVADAITQTLEVPTIGIGAGGDTSGQVTKSQCTNAEAVSHEKLFHPHRIGTCLSRHAGHDEPPAPRSIRAQVLQIVRSVRAHYPRWFNFVQARR